jgi:hypothetical protein
MFRRYVQTNIEPLEGLAFRALYQLAQALGSFLAIDFTCRHIKHKPSHRPLSGAESIPLRRKNTIADIIAARLFPSRNG